MPAMVGTAAIEFHLPDADGSVRSLHEFHRLGPAVLIFLPTVYGWRPRWQLWSLLRHCDHFVARSAEIVLISGDAVPELRIFQIRRGFPFVFLSDEARRTSAAYDPSLRGQGAASVIVNPRGMICYRRVSGAGRRDSGARLRRELRRCGGPECIRP